MKDHDRALAFHRFGLGARPGDIEGLSGDVRRALLDELAADWRAPFGGLPAASQLLTTLFEHREAQRLARQAAPPAASTAQPEAMKPAGGTPSADAMTAVQNNAQKAAREPGPVQPAIRAELAARLKSATAARLGFTERLALFWSNHFTVAGINQRVRILCGAFEREAIRPHVAGRFEEMLRAVAMHPAMLFYLDNERSIGPNSRAGQRRNKGLNENLAREILELHTVGVDAGYTQADVTRFAEILTGWTVVGPKGNGGAPGTFIFRPQMHEPGSRAVMSRSYPQSGVDQGLAVLSDLARHPTTARHVATKLCRHFIADTPPPAAIAKVEAAFKSSGGHLPAVYEALLALPEAWEPHPHKLRTPYEFVVAMMRGLAFEPELPRIINSLRLMGQPVFNAPSPKGWPDEAMTWAAPDAIKTRLDLAEIAARGRARGDALPLARNLLGPLLTDETTTALRRAESRQQAVTLLLMSPEFQRR